MSELHRIWKLLLKHEFWEQHKDTLPTSSFDAIGKDLLPTLTLAHSNTERDISEEELFMLHCSQHPTLTTANKNTVEAYIQNVKDEKEVSSEIAGIVYKALWRREVGRHVAEYGVRLADGDFEDTTGLADYVSKLGTSLVPEDFDEPEKNDPIELFTKLNKNGMWDINIPTLKRKIGKVSPGMFIILAGRPEASKTAALCNMIAGKDGGFAVQGAKVSLICNEEGADRSLARCICCYNQQSIHDVLKNPEMAATAGWKEISTRITAVHKPDVTISQLEKYLKKHRPDIICLDQIDHIGMSGTYESGQEKLGALYRKCRELCSTYNCVMIAVTQASADAEGKTVVTYSMLADSKTSKSAAADCIIGIGKADGEEEGDVVLRYYTVSKCKISGWKGTVVAKLIQSESRIVD